MTQTNYVVIGYDRLTNASGDNKFKVYCKREVQDGYYQIKSIFVDELPEKIVHSEVTIDFKKNTLVKVVK